MLIIIIINKQDWAFPAKLTGLKLTASVLYVFPCPNAKVRTTTFPKVSSWDRERRQQEKQRKRSQEDSLDESHEYPTVTKPKGAILYDWLPACKVTSRDGSQYPLATYKKRRPESLTVEPRSLWFHKLSRWSHAHQSWSSTAGKC